MAYYNLDRIKWLVREGRYRVTISARQSALAMGFDAEDVRNCILELDNSHFYKAMSSDQIPGLWQDVYKVGYEGWRVYLKLQICFVGEAVVISFKEDTDWA